ncbi:MAG: hypothetical protein AABZ55_00055 [Bdellovibrionota bacterium]
MIFGFRFLIICLWALSLSSVALSEEFSGEEGASEGETSESEVPVVPIESKSKALKGKRYREKEAEGTEAPDRFEADTIIKSRYRHNGEQLEVDPD